MKDSTYVKSLDMPSMPTDTLQFVRQTLWPYFAGQPGSKEASAFLSDDIAWHGSCPFDELNGRRAVDENFWQPLLAAFPDLDRRVDIYMAGEHDGEQWVAATGYFTGTFRTPWLRMSPTNKLTYIRFSEFLCISNGQVARSYLLLDLPSVARQCGKNILGAGLGIEAFCPGPASQDGVRLEPSTVDDSQSSLDLLERMIAGLMSYDQKSLTSMNQKAFWHPEMMWFGPSGIGTTRGLEGFQDHHQKPFLEFIPNRRGGNHYARFADGPYAASGGWPSITATTSGADWLHRPIPAGREITMRVMDFWRRDGDVLRENWVFIDIPDVFRQLGIDIFKILD